MYLDKLLPGFTSDSDDGNYGSAAMHDVLLLQSLSKRIHYGMFVAEAKFRQSTEEYAAMIRKGDRDGIMEVKQPSPSSCVIYHLHSSRSTLTPNLHPHPHPDLHPHPRPNRERVTLIPSVLDPTWLTLTLT